MNNVPICNTKSLLEAYTARGLALPSTAERAQLYEALELGRAVYYTGTAEQNTKLLSAIKKMSGCPVV